MAAIIKRTVRVLKRATQNYKPLERKTISQIGFASVLAILSGCSSIKLPNPPNGQSIKSPIATNQYEQTASDSNSRGGILSGPWRMGYKWNNQTYNASLTIEQTGNSFQGTGKEDESGDEFVIQQGRIQGDQLAFSKKYTGKKSSMAPIQYAGSLTTANEESYKGPYLSGDYSVTQKDGTVVSSEWDAVQDLNANQTASSQGSSKASQAASSTPQPEPDQATQNGGSPKRAPDLSGKWNVGYEYQFKTIHSVMFLEQDRDKIVGHGIDDTKEKFTVERGWYHFPKLTLIRKYAKTSTVKLKGKMREGKPAREMTFKADVSIANDKDYQGPYLSGKTDGGGNWEAELIK